MNATLLGNALERGPAWLRAHIYVLSLEEAERTASKPLDMWYRHQERIRELVREVEAERVEASS